MDFDWNATLDAGLALTVAAILGGLIGMEREVKGRWAGLRTHMMVSLGSCLFVLIGVTATRAHPAELSRVIQGIATGVGFIGAGTIIKLSERLEVKGLTTASTIWMAAAVGTGCGVQFYKLTILATLLAVIVLTCFSWVERWLSPGTHTPDSAITDGSQENDNGVPPS